MEKLTAEQILEKLKNSGITISEYAYESYVPPETGLGKIKEIKQRGGEGQGETWYTVKLFEDHDVYIKTEGWYTSYDGTDFNEGWGHEVKPTEKTITIYE
jgi:hypothetical protein